MNSGIHKESDSSRLARYWGKADPAVGALPGHHTVLGHSLDVAACAFVLVEDNPSLRRQFARTTDIAVERVALTLAAICSLHDVGKIDTRFQRKAPGVADVLRPWTRDTRVGSYDHGTEGFLQTCANEREAALVANLLGPSWKSLLRAVCGHHGSLPSDAEPDPTRSDLKRALRTEDAEVRGALVTSTLSLFAARGAELPWGSKVDGPLVQRLSGLCAVADWIGSNVEYLPYSSGPIESLDAYWEAACSKARVACEGSGLTRATPSTLSFGQLFPGFIPRDVQVLVESVDVTEPALIVIEAEMGKGKTEAALSLAARFLAAGEHDGITVTLPTMATSNAMFARVEDVLPRLFPDSTVQLSLAHGRASRHDRFQRLIEHRLEARDPDAPEASVTCARWLLNRKRILLAQVGVGTIDQALQAALVVRHQFVRMFGLSRNVVVIDEVHAYDAYMEVLLEELLGWLGALHVPVILLSATLPCERRSQLARAWRGESTYPMNTSRSAVVGFEAARNQTFPLVSVTTRTGTSEIGGAASETTKTIAVELLEASPIAHEDSVARRLLAAAREGARVVWIRNTVREAQRAFQAVEALSDGVEHLLFHARFRGCDRRRIEAAVLDRFGKRAPSGGRILVSTQVVEQSLDLDFDELHTDLAPIDLVLQRAGRLHRHDRGRPKGFDDARLVVHCPSASDVAGLRFGPSAYVYDTATLWIAHRALSARRDLVLPRDIRQLVEETYHSESRARLVALGGSSLVDAEQELFAEVAGRRTNARRCCIAQAGTGFDGGSTCSDDDDRALQPFTRDGKSTTLIPFAWDGASGRGLDDDPSVVAWNLDPSRSEAWRLASDLLDETLSLSTPLELSASVPTVETAVWNAWARRFARFAEDSGIGRRVVPLPLRATGNGFEGALQMAKRRQRVLYTRTHGLLMPNAEDEDARQ